MKLNCPATLNLSALERRFWLLMGEYDRLLQSLNYAIELRDFDLILSIQTRQDSILKALMALEGVLDHNPQYKDALQSLTQGQISNHKGIECLLKDLSKEMQQLNRKATTIQQVAATYSKSLDV